MVNINEVSTQVKSAKKAQYGKTDVGVVECDIDVKGTKKWPGIWKDIYYADGSQLSDKCCISVWGWGYYVGIRNTGKGISVLERYQVTGIFYDKRI